MLELQFNKSKFNKRELMLLELSSTDIYAHVLAILSRLQIHKTLDITESRLLDFIIDVSHHYQQVPYHSFHHAADIVTVLYYFCQNHVAGKYLSKMETALVLIAGLCHDIGHPGLNNAFQKNSGSELAHRYDKTESILESYSVDLTLELLDKHKIKKGHVAFKDSLRDLILFTDMTYHSELEKQVKTLINTLPTWVEKTKQTQHSSNISVLKDQQQQSTDVVHSELDDIQTKLPETEKQVDITINQSLSLCRIILHAADISNMARPWLISKQWSDLIVQEFFNQGDKEKSNEMTISPGMNRETCSQQNMSLLFREFILSFFESLAGLLPSTQVLVNHLAANRIHWENYVSCLDYKTTTSVSSKKRRRSCDIASSDDYDPLLVPLSRRRRKYMRFELRSSSYPTAPICAKPQFYAVPTIEFKPTLEVTTTVDTHIVLYHPYD
ncbi:HD-domain/PDEase-like protein [Backusella circina FSU 941]|nr:HD-domain/PDEase-like protein [Backusella circina FSU 941]